MLKIYRHNDLDGVGCEVVMRFKVDKGIEAVFACNYDTIDELLEKRLANKEDDSEIWILDICPSKAVCEKLNEFQKNGISVMLIDHHKSQAWVKKYPWATLDERSSATVLTFNEIGMLKSVNSTKSEEFVMAVDAWDRWQLDSAYRTRGEELNAILHFIGAERFVDIFKKEPNADLTYEKLVFIKNCAKENQKRSVDTIINQQLMKTRYYMDGLGQTFKVLVASEYIYQVAEAALKHPEAEDLKYIVVVNPVFGTCSLRSRESQNIDVSLIAQRFVSGGGHTHAAGFQTDIKRIIVEQLAKKLGEIAPAK